MLCLSPSLSLSSLLLQRHMALRHATHSIITSHIPWNTSSALFLLVVPGSQSRIPPPPPLLSHTLSFLHPPPPVLIPGRLWLPLQRATSSSVLICLSASHTGSICPHGLVCVGRRRASSTRTQTHNPAEEGNPPSHP